MIMPTKSHRSTHARAFALASHESIVLRQGDFEVDKTAPSIMHIP